MEYTCNEFMQAALEEAYEGIRNNHGGPFGCVVVKDGQIVGKGHNRVIIDKDLTNHGEMMAIRDACDNLDTYDLSGCELYTTAEPCPMCLGAIFWANIHKVYYGCSRLDSAAIGFRDDLFYQCLEGGSSQLMMCEIARDECVKLFNAYSLQEDRQLY